MAVLPWKNALIVGASSGMGQAVAVLLARSGCKVALVARRQDVLEEIAADLNRDLLDPLAYVYPHDVKSIREVPQLFSRIVEDLGGVDMVLYAAGIMPRIVASQYDTCQDEEIIATNFTGAVAWLNEAAARFEKMGSGTIVGLSSVAGDRGRRGNPVYGATKAALNTYLESLRNRIERRGAFVVTIKPGPVQTPMTAGLKMPGMVGVDEAAQGILDAARGHVRVAYVPGRWRFVMALIRAIPPSLFKWLNI